MTDCNRIELLAPARDTAIAREAILHGADAVYIGGPAFGARHAAGNSMTDIAGLVEFAHAYHVRVYLALNTILRDEELEDASRLARQCWDAGVDALIVQDMALLELDLPPIALHASTQCDIRTPEKARFLAGAGFSQLILARELTLGEVTAIAAALPRDVVVEYFIHGALCVAFSGQCYISHAQTGRSANRGDCSQACRLPYTLQDERGRIVAQGKHLLSLKDNNQSANLEALLAAGVRSFKIEGRYKDAAYVKNVTGHYRRLLDDLLAQQPHLAPLSSGRCQLSFVPDPDKTFHRGSTDYFTRGRQIDITAFDSPAFVGVPFGTVVERLADALIIESEATPANGDGLTCVCRRQVVGFQVNRAEHLGGQRWRITPHIPLGELAELAPGMAINRNRDHAWEHALSRDSASRKIGVIARLGETATGLRLTLVDGDGNCGQAEADLVLQPARQPAEAPQQLRRHLDRFGDSEFELLDLHLHWREPWFLPPSVVNTLRRQATTDLQAKRLASHPRPVRRSAGEVTTPYPETKVSFLGNVFNELSEHFYRRHGVSEVARAFEAHGETGEVPLMITRHCLRYSFSLCPRQAKGIIGVQGQVRAEPMTLSEGRNSYRLEFDCRACEMHVIGHIGRHVLAAD